MKWYTVEEKFLTYLRNVEKRIPKIDYGDDKFKPFFGKLFEIGDLVYITQVSSRKQRYLKMKENLDFIKLYDSKNDSKKIIAVVNLNYMFPVHKSKLIEVEYKNIENFRTFKDTSKKNSYIVLLKKEMKEIRDRNVNDKAVALYKRKYDYPEDRVSLRCFDFKLLEQKCIEYTQQLESIMNKEIAVAKEKSLEEN
ncbi:MAG: type III toxin-antitoxin system ToxN/AbiQ family toxin [Halanaerobiales bacterium]|nr:type III toxin-antitoxin system ToxN/AbiQ family toxin [Halanaerobiales bacterium]